MLLPIVSKFLNYLKLVKGSSEKTISEYRYDLNIFIKFIFLYKIKKIDIKSIDSIKLEQYYNNLSKLDYSFLNTIDLNDLYEYISYLDLYRNESPTTRSRKISTIRSFYNYYYKKLNLLDENITEKLETPKISKKNPVYLTLEESIKLLQTINISNKNDFIKKRDFSIILLFLNSGMRLSELSEIKIYSIKEEKITVIGKGDKQRTIYINQSCIIAINEYLMVRPNVENNDYLFLSTRRQKMSNRAIQHRIEHYFKIAGFDTSIYSTHKLRHTAATLMYKHGGVDIRSLQQILGHTSVSTTQIYTHIDDDSLREASKKNPLSEIDI